MRKYRNTYRTGIATVIIYPEKDLFTAVCLEFDLVRQSGNFKEVKRAIDSALKSHVEAIIKNKLPEDLLNRPAPKEYWVKASEILQKLNANVQRPVSDTSREQQVSVEKTPIRELVPSLV